ncbi:MAG: GNAT family N-acetyltransferase [Deltaproteobacteria bacterium]|nr:MAG: GNAT family N-acetyltransferase [Deltaproteobacteria bacterium]
MRTIRPATPADAATLHRFIVELAVYEKEPDAVEVTPEILASQIAQERPPFECVLAEVDGEPVGYALFFHTYSTWRGAPGLYLEDLYVTPERRGAGHGRALLAHLAAIAVERGCARMEWSVLDWNEPAIGFYKALGAFGMDEWTVHRLTREPLYALAASADR